MIEENRKIREDEDKVRSELQKAGIEVDGIYDLVNTSDAYPKAIPVLLNLLKTDALVDDRIKEGVIRALAVKEAKGLANNVLLEEFYKIPKEKMLLRWVIGSTMEVITTENEVDEIIKIVRDKSNGMSRQLFVEALGKIKSEKIENVLIELLEDEEVVPHALNALGKLKSKQAKPYINQLLHHKNSLFRKEAQKALKKID